MALAKELQAKLAAINKKYGSETILVGSQISHEALPRVTSGSLALDVALGGGWPANQWNEIYADESHGKTVLALKTVAANQALNPDWVCLWIAAEEWVGSWAKTLGCDLDRIIVIDSNAMEFVYQQILEFSEERLVDGIVLDSLPNLVPEREDINEIGEIAVGLGPLLTGQFFRKQNKTMKRSLLDARDRPITGFIINQFREKIGVMRGDPRTTPGGRAKNFAYFTRVQLARDEWIEEGDIKVGQVIKARVTKNKSAPAQRVATIDFHFSDHGEFKAGDYDAVKEIVAVGITKEVITRAGAYYRFGGEQWQGRAPLVEQLRSDLSLREQISRAVLDVVTRGLAAPALEVVSQDITPQKSRKIARRAS